jgi:hypothetical protein
MPTLAIFQLYRSGDKMKTKTNKKYTTLPTVPKSNRKIVVRDKIDTLNTNTQDRSLTFLD